MSKPIYIFSSSNYFNTIESELPSLKPTLLKVCGKNIRRIDRLTQLALIGAFQCKTGFTLPKNTGIYLSSIYGSLSNTLNILKEIYQEHNLPRPLNFINTVSNAANFYLAAEMELSSVNQFITREHFALEGALKIAMLDLEMENVDASIVGVVNEAGKNQRIHRNRFKFPSSSPLKEGSHFMLLAHKMNNEVPIAKIIKSVDPVNKESAACLLENHKDNAELTIAFGSNVNSAYRGYFNKIFSNERKINSADKINSQFNSEFNSEFNSAYQSCNFLEQCKSSSSKKRFAYLDTDLNQAWSILIIESYQEGL